MQELKPVAWMCDANDGANADATASERVRDDYARFGRTIIDLYALPSTHRIVPVELLKFAAKCMQNDNDQTESFLCSIGRTEVPSYLLKERAFTEELRAIIDKEPT